VRLSVAMEVDRGADQRDRREDEKRHEVGFADLAIGVLGVLCCRFRDGFLLAAVLAVSISYLGDAYGHIHQTAIHDNHAPDNTGLVLWADFIAPLVAISLYALRRRADPAPA
jgi:hypothetical protein